MNELPFRPHHVEWTEEKVSRFWDFMATSHGGDFFSEKHSRDLSNLVLRLRPTSLVDIGCGTGPFAAQIARLGVRTIGVDSSPAVLEAARNRTRGIVPAPEFHLGSITNLPLRDSSVDAATLFEVVEHLDDETLARTLSEARRILAPGGTLVLTTPNSEDLRASTVQCPDCGSEFHVVQHVRSWTPLTLRAAIENAGFGNVGVRSVRFVENGPRLERTLRRVYYRLRPHRPRLVAVGTRV